MDGIKFKIISLETFKDIWLWNGTCEVLLSKIVNWINIGQQSNKLWSASNSRQECYFFLFIFDFSKPVCNNLFLSIDILSSASWSFSGNYHLWFSSSHHLFMYCWETLVAYLVGGNNADITIRHGPLISESKTCFAGKSISCLLP